MGEIRLFHVIYDGVHELSETSFQKEKELQRLFEGRLRVLTGIDFLHTEYPAGHHGRIDTLGIDAQGCPVVIEYKRSQNETIINQGLHYLEWLKDHRADVRLLVRDKYGHEREKQIDLKGAWLLCVARKFTDWDVSTAKSDSRRVELVSCRRYGGEFGSNLILEWVWPEKSSVPTSMPAPAPSVPVPDPNPGPWFLESARKELHAFIVTLGKDVKVTERQTFTRFDRHGHYAIGSIRRAPSRGRLIVHARLDPKRMRLERDFTRDVRDKGRHGIGDLEITIHDRAALERAKPLLREAYERN